MTDSISWHLFASAQELAEAAALRIQSAAAFSIKETGMFKLVLSGGSTPAACYKHLVQADTDWSKWHIFYGDERCLPVDHPERNSTMATEVWLSQVAIHAKNIHPIPAEMGAAHAAERYEQIIKPLLPFDMVLLGLGEDGHTASLFPGHEHPQDKWVVPVAAAPKPPSDRVSLSYQALRESHDVTVLVTGAAKRAAVTQWRAAVDLPIQRLVSPICVNVLIDQEALPD